MNRATLIFALLVIGVAVGSIQAQTWQQPGGHLPSVGCNPVRLVPVRFSTECPGYYSPQFVAGRFANQQSDVAARPVIFAGPEFRPLGSLATPATTHCFAPTELSYQPYQMPSHYGFVGNCSGVPFGQSVTTSTLLPTQAATNNSPATTLPIAVTPVNSIPQPAQTQIQSRAQSPAQSQTETQVAKPAVDGQPDAPLGVDKAKAENSGGYSVLEKPKSDDK